MSFQMFHELCPEVGFRETRTVALSADSDLGLPADNYAFLEMYCSEADCDCRRVYFQVIAVSNPAVVLAAGGGAAVDAGFDSGVMALAIDPLFAPALLTVGSLEYQYKRRDSAMAMFLTLTTLPPGEPDLDEVIDKAGCFLLDQNDTLNATRLYRAATEADIARWEAAGRDDILAWVDPFAVGDAFVYDLWIDPETGDDVSCCPWLEQVPGTDRYTCGIHDLKPDHCRRYPQSRKHADETGCPGYGHTALA